MITEAVKENYLKSHFTSNHAVMSYFAHHLTQITMGTSCTFIEVLWEKGSGSL